MTWTPHVTVATVVERDDKYLLVYERSREGMVYNQPAGHLEANESLEEAALRETLEETGWHVRLTGVLGVSLYTSPHNGTTYHRTSFTGEVLSHDSQQPLDDGIEAAVWLSYEEILEKRQQLRSPLVLKVIQDYRAGRRYPLELVYDQR